MRPPERSVVIGTVLVASIMLAVVGAVIAFAVLLDPLP